MSCFPAVGRKSIEAICTFVYYAGKRLAMLVTYAQQRTQQAI
jgi:hypothetical protein